MQEKGRPARWGNVLVATDFSQPDAVDRAVLLPVRPGSSFTLLHVAPTGLPGHLERSFRHATERMLSGLAARATVSLRARGEGEVDIFTAVEAGTPVEVICEQAARLRAQLVVVGRTGVGRTATDPIGATAERVARASDTPVLVVSGSPRGPYQHPLVAIDGTEKTPAVVELALRVAGPGMRTAVLAHAFAVPELGLLRYAEMSEADMKDYVDEHEWRARRRIERLLPTLPSLGVQYEPVVLDGDARRVLLEEASRRASDLVVVGSRGHSRLIHLLLGSVAEAVVRNATVDVLVAR